jgi:4-hydroxy-4-methyl-2-oxoglutarate aldolase
MLKLSPELIDRLHRVETSCVADADKSVRAIDTAIHPITNKERMIGIAHTVQCHEDFLTVLKALENAKAGDVLVIDTQNSVTAVAGELFASEAKRKGLAGIVIDGACRDTTALKQIGLPVYARSINPVSGMTQSIGKIGIPITCGGVNVSPGDLILGDQDGIVVMNENELIRILPLAEEIQQLETKLLNKIGSGESLLDLCNLSEHWNQREANRNSHLKFKI